eukprot:353839-Chlamydomonas_euryale.AAC.60
MATARALIHLSSRGSGIGACQLARLNARAAAGQMNALKHYGDHLHEDRREPAEFLAVQDGSGERPPLPRKHASEAVNVAAVRVTVAGDGRQNTISSYLIQSFSGPCAFLSFLHLVVVEVGYERVDPV